MAESKYAQNIIGTNLLTKFHEDRKINIASRVLTRKNAPPPGSHVFQPSGTIFELVQDIIGMNLLTKFHEDRTVDVASKSVNKILLKPYKEKCTAPWKPFFQTNIIIFELIQDTIEANLLTKFHEDWTINVAAREKCPAPGSHVFKATKTIFELIQDIIGTNLLTKFHDDRKINVTSRVLTRKIAPPPWWQFIQEIIGMNLVTEFHEDRTINVASRVKNAPPLGSHVFQANVTIFELIQDIIKTNLLTIFHQDWIINVASRVFTRKNAPPPGGHVIQPTGIIFELVQYIIGMNLLTNHVFQAKVTIFKLIQDISGKNLLSKFHEDQKINVASRVLTRFYYSHIPKNTPPPGGHVFQPTGIIFELVQDIIGINLLTKKNAPPLCSHVFQANVIIFELIQDIIETNLLTKFHEDWTINVASRVNKANVDAAQRTTDNGRRTKSDHKSSKNALTLNVT
ncbi:hypothetical protein DPMN_152498 [Dreissena polymorpha]|uniref:Uncharacterized protein n=1 Tax=Dreissena polymorpha TaxID=45954 RepID=A0A9D4FHK1_DREPO|nr:hypothetical protein DPMN_152498 [Dreissena polymorpha]